MRLLFILILGGFVGWIVGSLYPAPPALLAWINVDAIQQRLNNGAEQQTPAAPAASTTTTLTPGATPSSSATPAPAAAPAPSTTPAPSSQSRSTSTAAV